MAGSWIEGLYITSQIALTAGDNTKFLEIIAHQKNSLSTLLEVMDPVKDDADAKEIYSSLTELSKLYETIEEIITDEQLVEISNSIETLRNNIV